MSEKPEALRLADCLGQHWTLLSDQIKAAAELRRLHTLNQNLLEALRYIEGLALANDWRDLPTIAQTARAAIAKAEGTKP